VRRSKRPGHVLPRGPWGWIGASGLAIICIGAYFAGSPLLWPGSPTVVPNPGAHQTTKAENNGSEQDVRAKAEAEATRLADAGQFKREQEYKADAAANAKVEDDRRQAEAEAKRRAEEEAARRDPALSVSPGSGQTFRDRLADGNPCPMCPEMVVAPANSFTMGSPASEPERTNGEVEVRVTIARSFAVGKFAVNVTTSSFTANWNASQGATDYRIDVSTSSSFSVFSTIDIGNALSRTTTGLSTRTSYYYRVRAYDSAGASANSNTITVTTR
jgi:hypothetical protein